LGSLISCNIVSFDEYTNKWHSWQNKRLYLIFQAQQLECEQGPLQRQIVELENCVSSLSQQVQQEQKHRQEENQLLARHLAERTQHIEVLVQQLEDQEGENQVLRRKQASALKVRIDVNTSL
jgi:predicted RNase H-like nuclease (RuvC/YqgF family)